jgi:hypothetical protein
MIYSPTLDRYLDPTVSHFDPWSLPLEDQGASVLHIPFHKQDQTTTSTQKGNSLLKQVPFLVPQQESVVWEWDLAIHTLPKLKSSSVSFASLLRTASFKNRTGLVSLTGNQAALIRKQHEQNTPPLKHKVTYLHSNLPIYTLTYLFTP